MRGRGLTDASGAGGIDGGLRLCKRAKASRRVVVLLVAAKVGATAGVGGKLAANVDFGGKVVVAGRGGGRNPKEKAEGEGAAA